ncbi:MAG: CopG family transcriptional regulator [Acidobacteriota bacterium]
MRTTLDIDDDVLQAAKELASAHRKTAGQMLSTLARAGLTPVTMHRMRNGVPVLPRRAPGGARPTMKQVNQLRDEP